MTPELSPYPIAVSEASSLAGLKEIADWMREKKVGYVIAKDRKKPHLHVLWRAELPKKADENKTEFRFFLERGRTDGPKPGTATWDGKIVETWKP